MDTKKIKIGLGLLSNRGFKNQTVVSLLEMINESPEYEWEIILSINGYSISENRNWLAVQSVKRECDYLMMIDDDMVFPPDTARKMFASDKDIIGVPYHTKVFPKKVNVMTLDDNPASDTEPTQVSAIGTGIILIKTKVFKELPQPFFDIDKVENGFTTMGEDFWFCRKAIANGFEVWSEPLEIGHLGDYLY